jgi:putative redox protein
MSTLDGSPAVGPMGLLLAALGGCTGMDIASILAKKRVDLTGLEVRVSADRTEEYPKVWKDIEVVYIVRGNDIQAKDVERAIALSEEKYCSVSSMLGKAASIKSTYRILKPDEPE